MMTESYFIFQGEDSLVSMKKRKIKLLREI